MHILLYGGTGLIGSALCHYFIDQGHTVTVWARHNSTYPIHKVHYITTQPSYTDTYDVIINLVGNDLTSQRWTEQFVTEIYNSRIEATENIIRYIRFMHKKPGVFINASAIGYYNPDRSVVYTEETENTELSMRKTIHFLRMLCRDWECVARQAEVWDCRVCTLRTGIVLSREGGALQKMLPFFRYGLGACLGDGNQWMSWIHIDDVVSAIAYIIMHEHLKGPINLTAPTPVTHQFFNTVLARTLRRPYLLKIPAYMTRLIYGDMADMILEGAHVVPHKLLENGYTFQYTKIEDALQHLLV